jgi:hypothetical protein
MKQRRGHYLFRENKHTYAVLDGASVPDLPVKLHEMRPPNVCLYRGELSPDLQYVAPYLVYMLPEMEFTNWLLSECWGKHWGIFAQSALTLTAMRRHFRSLLTVYDETGKPMLFRYYDPRVFLTYLPTCSNEELEDFFGSVTYYFAESDGGTRLNRYEFVKNELKKASLDLEFENQS